ncbi:hypothetical protein [Martelella radicis]|uniref:Exonuclease domain-containing protein n=1 Tax=Martelella radicis TaxID=1397476 RepID=A0A7W6PBU7_9HYPH|nr:hypothetical protein [Martelella radicis]MBB4124285.1 hypothetical protein [Martelella radicis]
MIGKNIETLMALDFEASSLSAESWPIEVGISWIEGNQVQTWSSLIRPASVWNRADWSKQSEAVHGISMSDLETAPTVENVAQQLMPKIEGFILVSDAPRLETDWLSRLLGAARWAPSAITVEDYDAVSFTHFDGLALDFLYEKLERMRVPHRAGADSARLASGWLKALQVREQQQSG